MGVQAQMNKASFLADLRGQMQPDQAAAPNPRVVPAQRSAPDADDEDAPHGAQSREDVIAAQPSPKGRQV